MPNHLFFQLNVVDWKGFDDHRRYSESELAFLANWCELGPVICTEKDLARLPPQFPVHVLRVEVEMSSEIEPLEARLRSLWAS